MIPDGRTGRAAFGGRAGTAGLAVLLAWVVAAPAQAQLIMQAQNSTAPVGGTGAFDVTLSDTGGSFHVGGFSVEISVPVSSGVTFTNATADTTAAPYVFGTLQNPPFTFDSFPNTDTTVSDTYFAAPGYVTLNAANTYGLGHFTYAVANGTPLGPVTVRIIPGGSSLSDENGDPVAFTPIDGTIAVSPVPEPATLALTGVAALAGVVWRRRNASAKRC